MKFCFVFVISSNFFWNWTFKDRLFIFWKTCENESRTLGQAVEWFKFSFLDTGLVGWSAKWFLKINASHMKYLFLHTTLSLSLMFNGKHPHWSNKESMYCFVVQSVKDMSFWHPLTFWSKPRYESVILICFRTFRLYSPSPYSDTGSKEKLFNYVFMY